MLMNTWEPFFKPEIRSSGRSFVEKGKVSLSQPSDTEIQAYIKASTSLKVTFKSDSIDSKTITVDCTCPQSKKGQFCKHIWATLLVIDEKKSDFLDSKNDLQKKSHLKSETSASLKIKKSQAQIDSQAAYKLKQANYQKEQYQKQKQRLKDIKAKKNAPKSVQYPTVIENALEYFLSNGFNLRDSITQESIGLAMKKLARIFHPDVGGSHEEILELNKHAEILIKYSKS